MSDNTDTTPTPDAAEAPTEELAADAVVPDDGTLPDPALAGMADVVPGVTGVVAESDVRPDPAIASDPGRMRRRHRAALIAAAEAAAEGSGDLPDTCGRAAMFSDLDVCRDRIVDPAGNVCRRCVDYTPPAEAVPEHYEPAVPVFDGTFDPSQHDVATVLAHLEHAPADEITRVLKVERMSAKPRKSILALG